MDSVEVKTLLVERVPQPIARQLCEDFAEWLDSQGFEIQVKPGRATDDRGYDELARDFIEEYS